MESRASPYLRKAVVEEDTEEAGGDGDLTQDRALHDRPHDVLQLRAGVRVVAVGEAVGEGHRTTHVGRHGDKRPL